MDEGFMSAPFFYYDFTATKTTFWHIVWYIKHNLGKITSNNNHKKGVMLLD